MCKSFLLIAWLSLPVMVFSQNLVAYYPFNGNANDESGNGIQPSYIGTGVTLTTDRFGNANRAYFLDGNSGSYIRMPADLLPTTNRTVSIWFYATSVSIRPQLLAYGGQGFLGYGTSFLMGLNSSGCACYHTQAHYGSNAVSFGYGTEPINQWIHWVVTINGNTTKMYVNGNLTLTAPNSFYNTTYVAGRDLAIGVMINAAGIAPYTDVNGNYFQGKLDDIRIYDAALTDAQVSQLYKNESTGLIAYYPFNGNTNDESGNNLNLTNAGVTFISDRAGNSNSACYFNGAASLSCPDNDLLDLTNDFTVSFWINRPSSILYQFVLSKHLSGDDNNGYSILFGN
jgi:hypothetical protein